VRARVAARPSRPDGTRPGWTSALARVVMSYVLLGLDRRRIVVDPDVRDEKVIVRFLRQGFTAGPVAVLPELGLPDVYLPQKRAQLAFLPRGATIRWASIRWASIRWAPDPVGPRPGSQHPG
jgi:hypothetical protein